MLPRLAAAGPQALAIEDLEGRRVTFAQLLQQAERTASCVPPRARRVAIPVHNDIDSVARIFGVWLAGASAVVIGGLLPAREAALRVSETRCDGVLDLPAAEAPLPPGEAPADTEEALIVFTSGTTGRPKGTVLSFDALLASCRSMARGIGLPVEGRLPTEPARRATPVLTPLSHMSGALGVLSGWYLGKPLLLLPKFDVPTLFDLVERYGVDSLKLTPTMIYDLAAWPEELSLGSVRSVTVGTAALPEATQERFERRFGVPVLRTYGQTEFAGAIAFERYSDVKAGRRPPRTSGRVAPGVEVRIVDTNGAEVAVGEPGEIWARGGNAMRGYLGEDGRPVPPGPNRWLATGDLGVIDEDWFLTILGRVRDVIICGGFNVYPAMVEAALNRLPGIADSAVAGAPDPRLGEVPVAVVVPEAKALTLEEVRAELRTYLAPYELPRRLTVVEAIPRTDGGKIDRPAVVRLAAELPDQPTAPEQASERR